MSELWAGLAAGLVGAAFGALLGVLSSAYLEDRRLARESYARIRGNILALTQLQYSNLEAKADFDSNLAVWKLRGQPAESLPLGEAMRARERMDALGPAIAERTATMVIDLANALASLPPGEPGRPQIVAALTILEEGVSGIQLHTNGKTEAEIRALQVNARSSVEAHVNERYRDPLTAAYKAMPQHASAGF